MTTEIIKEIIEDLKINQLLVEPEKADMIYMLQRMYNEECSAIEDEIKKLLNKWD